MVMPTTRPLLSITGPPHCLAVKRTSVSNTLGNPRQRRPAFLALRSQELKGGSAKLSSNVSPPGGPTVCETARRGRVASRSSLQSNCLRARLPLRGLAGRRPRHLRSDCQCLSTVTHPPRSRTELTIHPSPPPCLSVRTHQSLGFMIGERPSSTYGQTPLSVIFSSPIAHSPDQPSALPPEFEHSRPSTS